MHRKITSGAFLVFCVAALIQPLQAQLPVTRLTEPSLTYPEPFGLLSGFRELSDGRVMVGDPLGQALVVIDLASGRADTLGKVGPGPAEFSQPDRLFPLGGDSTLLLDLGNARFLVITPEGEFGKTTPIVRSTGQGGPRGMTFVLPGGIDRPGPSVLSAFPYVSSRPGTAGFRSRGSVRPGD